MESSHVDLEQMLLSEETIERAASPDLWPEQLPGISEFVSPSNGQPSPPPKWVQNFKDEDMEMLQEFGSLTTSQLLEKVKSLQNLAYQLGLEEAHEMTRGKFLNILERPPKRL